MKNNELSFYDIPGYDNYQLNQLGQVVNKLSGIELTGSTNPDGYHNFRLTGNDGYVLTWGRHRLLAYVFKHPNTDISDLIVNHKNGIKGDDRLDNLEWGTYQYNAEHAGANGLTVKCQPIAVRDLRTNTVLEFPSIIKCAQYFNVKKDTVNWRLKAGKHRVFDGFLQYSPLNEIHEWNAIVSQAEIDRQGRKIKIQIRNVVTNTIAEYDSMSEAAMNVGIPVSTMSVWLSKDHQPVLPGYLQVRIANVGTPWREIKDPVLELARFTGKRPVVARNHSTNVETIYASSVECCKALGLKPNTLFERLKSNGKIVFKDNFSFIYYGQVNQQ